MLSREDNELLVRVGPDTAMGKLMRLYWIPFLIARDVPADGQPYRVKLLGEELVAFRDSAGQVGLVDQACPHRGAPLVFARNEEGGLRCVYHGWKFAVDGTCKEMPAEGRDSFVAKFGTLYTPQDLAHFLEQTHAEPAVAAELANPERRYCLAEIDGQL